MTKPVLHRACVGARNREGAGREHQHQHSVFRSTEAKKQVGRGGGQHIPTLSEYATDQGFPACDPRSHKHQDGGLRVEMQPRELQTRDLHYSERTNHESLQVDDSVPGYGRVVIALDDRLCQHGHIVSPVVQQTQCKRNVSRDTQ